MSSNVNKFLVIFSNVHSDVFGGFLGLLLSAKQVVLERL